MPRWRVAVATSLFSFFSLELSSLITTLFFSTLSIVCSIFRRMQVADTWFESDHLPSNRVSSLVGAPQRSRTPGFSSLTISRLTSVARDIPCLHTSFTPKSVSERLCIALGILSDP